MKRLFASVLFSLVAATQAFGMGASSVPAKFPLTWGQNAGASFIRSIPTNSQIGITPGAASLNDGFPPLTFTPITAGGTPPFGQDMNGILNQLSAWSQWQSAGGPVTYDSGFSGSISGYPKGAVLQSSSTTGWWWLNGLDNNSTNPDAGGTNWTGFSPLAFYAVDSGTTNAAAVTFPVGITSIGQLLGYPLSVKKINSTNTGAMTLQVGGTAATAVHHIDGTNLNNGDLPAGGIFTVVYDGSFYQLQSPVLAQGAILGTAAAKNTTDNTKPTVAAVSGAITNSHIAIFADNFGTVKDSGLQTSSFAALPILASQTSQVVMGGIFRNLKITASGGSKSETVTADAIEVTTPSDTLPFTCLSPNHTLNISGTGANGLDTGSAAANTAYYTYEIYNGTSCAALASTSSTAPSMPVGYTYKMRDGAFFTDASSNIIAGTQVGRSYQYKTPQKIVSGAIGTWDSNAPTWSSMSVSGFVPGLASKINVIVQTGYNGTIGYAAIAPNTGYGGVNSTTAPPACGMQGPGGSNTTTGTWTCSVVLESSNIALVSNVTAAFWTLGWEDNL